MRRARRLLHKAWSDRGSVQLRERYFHRAENLLSGIIVLPAALRAEIWEAVRRPSRIEGTIGDGGGTLRITCETENSHVRVEVRAQPSPDMHIAPADGAFEHACEVAAALLDAGGGSLECGSAGATLIIPRAVSM